MYIHIYIYTYIKNTICYIKNVFFIHKKHKAVYIKNMLFYLKYVFFAMDPTTMTQPCYDHAPAGQFFGPGAPGEG